MGERRIEALIVIGGSTASGKSALALAVAEALEGVVINADSQQLFADLSILTARPTPADEARVPHRLYGILAAHEQPSVGRWLAAAAAVLAECRAQERSAVVTGGTGLYLHALLHGISDLPAIPREVRQRVRAWAEPLPTAALHARLERLDPIMAARLHPGDRQRLLRALEVVEATGRSLAAWQAGPRRPLLLPARHVAMALVPPAVVVNPRLETRLAAMLAAGALAEIAALLQRRPDALRLPIAKVHGLRELAAVHEGRMTPAAASAGIAAQVRQYAKRQRTWFRHQLPELTPVPDCGEDATLAAELIGRVRAG